MKTQTFNFNTRISFLTSCMISAFLLSGCDNRPKNILTLEVQVNPKNGEAQTIKKDCKILTVCQVEYRAYSPNTQKQEVYKVKLESVPDTYAAGGLAGGDVDTDKIYEGYFHEVSITPLRPNANEGEQFNKEGSFKPGQKIIYEGKLKIFNKQSKVMDDMGDVRIIIS